MSAHKRKRTDFTLKKKEEIINTAKKEPNQCKLAREMSKKPGIKVKRTTMKGILSKKDAMEAVIKAGIPLKRMKLMQTHDPKLDEGLLMWLKQVRRQNLSVSGDLIKEKMMKLAELMHIPDFMASDGWLDNFKKRHNITFKAVQGEARAVDSQSLLERQQQVLQPLLGQFSTDNVFNLDATGLFWQLLPNKTMTFRVELCTGGKKSKQRITLLVGANVVKTNSCNSTISTTTTTFNEQPTCNLHLRLFSRPQTQQRHVYDRAQPATDAAPHHLSLKLRRRR
ncbi:HTH CenpB-type DNA-binding domain [Trinorchestia longiramus]|nr:HTH CenpB-type DNA-binding domain [Trinorchestia longiramus]